MEPAELLKDIQKILQDAEGQLSENEHNEFVRNMMAKYGATEKSIVELIDEVKRDVHLQIGEAKFCPNKHRNAKKSRYCTECGYSFGWWNTRFVPFWNTVIYSFKILNPIIDLAGLIALFIGVYELTKVHHLEDQTQSMVKEIHSFDNLIHTKPIGDFPDNIKNLTDLIKKTDSSLVIAVDYASYGYFSDQNDALIYEEELRKALLIKKIKLSLTTYTVDLQKKELFEQFNVPLNEGDNKALIDTLYQKNENKFRSKYDIFKATNGIKDKITFNELCSILSKHNQDFITSLYADGNGNGKFNFKISYDSTFISTFYWNSDNKTVAISFVNLGTNSRERTILSQDEGLIEFFNSSSAK